MDADELAERLDRAHAGETDFDPLEDLPPSLRAAYRDAESREN